MYIKLRSLDGRENVVTISKTASVASLKKMVEENFGIPECDQKLFYAGKILDSKYTLFDYNMNVNDTVQVMETSKIAGTSKIEEEVTPEEIPCESAYFEVGDVVDACDATHGAWFEGKIIDIVKCPPDDVEIYYKVQFTYIPSAAPTLVTLQSIRPVSRNTIPVTSIKENDLVMVNYNLTCPEDRGYWYDMKVKEVITTKSEGTCVQGTLYAGLEKTPIDNIRVIFPDEIMEIPVKKLIADKTPEELELMTAKPVFNRKTAPLCDKCKDIPRRKCRQCGCDKCGGKEDPDKQIVCDECECSYHIWCLDPPLTELPETDDWYCSGCKNDDEVVKAGDKLKKSAKKGKMASSLSTSNRDWGRGMACVGRTRECSIVGIHHFGPIPGVEVGTLWKYRFQVSESGVHRPHVAGIHGTAKGGAYSIALSGGYEDDIDNGEEFLYTGSGGRDLSKNKRTAEQSCDQTLTKLNRALARNCDAKISEDGAEAANWRKGKPVRVVRNYKLAKHSKYAPEDGNRYDGIYKVVKYYPVTGRSGFKVWRYLLRRDDPAPAPWTKDGIKRSASLGLTMQYPESYLQSTKNAKRSREEDQTAALKKMKISYSPGKKAEEAISADHANSKMWTTLRAEMSSGQTAFLDKVKETFTCVCCMGLVYNPVTTPCSHNTCKDCLDRSFRANIYSCPCCRADLGIDFTFKVNEDLSKALHLLFPGYTASN